MDRKMSARIVFEKYSAERRVAVDTTTTLYQRVNIACAVTVGFRLEVSSFNDNIRAPRRATDTIF